MSGHIGSTIVSIICSCALAAAVLAWFGSHRALTWIANQREALTRQVANSGTLNRETLRKAWGSLQPLGGQSEILPPTEGGNELRLHNNEEARILAKAAAETVKQPLRMQAPFAFGLPASFTDPDDIAEEVLKNITPPTYPIVVSPDNEWSRAAITAQVSSAIDAATRMLRKPLDDLNVSLVWAMVLAGMIQLGLTALSACRDIKVNPKVK